MASDRDRIQSPSWEEDRRAWNAARELELARYYGSAIEISYTGPQPILSLAKMASIAGTKVFESNVIQLQSKTASICSLQYNLTREWSKHVAVDDFENRWMAQSGHQREELILEGLVRLFQNNLDPLGKNLCPELTLARLNHRSGKGFIDLVGKLTLQDVSKVPTVFRTVPNDVYEVLHDAGDLPLPAVLWVKQDHDADRTHCLTMVAWHILLAFYGESQTFGLSKGPRPEREQLEHFRESLRISGAPVDAESIINKVRAIRASAQRSCHSCRLVEQSDMGPITSACQGCKLIGRLVYYCSKQCQATDWKSGNPPHKTICGKKDAILDAFLAAPPPSHGPTAPTGDDRFGPAAAGYTRSPALLHQLALLQQNPRAEYVFMKPHSLQFFAAVMPHGTPGDLFKNAMRRAVCQHSPADVVVMYCLLQKTARVAPGIGVENLRDQLLKEYGVDQFLWNVPVQRTMKPKLRCRQLRRHGYAATILPGSLPFGGTDIFSTCRGFDSPLMHDERAQLFAAELIHASGYPPIPGLRRDIRGSHS
ncbi:hypothetical protein FB45DRAFT_1032010 [Roridomyces roridus]|uniref:MYND-type domain-containing protein n=1 Tax=Roridomyces roridus TaxID=1738132 RepID=A0AAD7BIR9_9AGAR|nr:hypothetical protein FB45DRAFT_1032010 [Roridomyces roridus]